MEAPVIDGNFSFSLKPKSPGKSSAKSPLKSAEADDDGAGDDGDYHEEEENNTYFTPVIPLPDKIEVKTGEENEELLYVHRAKLYRYVDHEWKERGVGDVKILRHKETRKLRVVMRRDQVLKICLNHALNDSVEYKVKDDKTWRFVVNDFSEGLIELEQFALRFKTKEIAEGFMEAVKAALDGSAAVVESNSCNTSLNTSAAALAATTVSATSTSISTTTLSSSAADFQQKKLCEKLQLPEDFMSPKPPCSGCRGCDSETFVFPESSESKDSGISADEQEASKMPELPMELPNLHLPPSAIKDSAVRSILKQSALTQSPQSNGGSPAVGNSNNTTIKMNESLFSGFGNTASNANSTTLASSAADAKPASNITFSFASALNKNEGESTAGGDLFSGAPLFGSNATENKPLFGTSSTTSGSSIFGGGSSTNTGSLFAGKSLFESNSNSIFAPKSADADKENKKVDETSKDTTTSNTTTSIFGGTGSANNSLSGSTTFGGSGFGSGASLFGAKPVFGSGQPLFGPTTGGDTTKSIFGATLGGSPATNASIFGNNQSTTTTTATTNNSIFNFKPESAAGGDKSSTTAAATTTTFADLVNKPGTGVLDFASLAANAKSNNELKTEKPGPGGFIGLTNQQDAFSTPDKNGHNDSAGGNGVTGDADGGENHDENYDPHYDPIIELPNEIVVSTGEENETKLFGERATLYRYDATNKEWKERGVGELKLLEHKQNHTYRLVMRREQIHKLVLNHYIGADFSFNNMNNNQKSFVWATMNFAESNEGELEKLAVRFKKVELADEFKQKLNECIAAAKNQIESAA